MSLEQETEQGAPGCLLRNHEKRRFLWHHQLLSPVLFGVGVRAPTQAPTLPSVSPFGALRLEGGPRWGLAGEAPKVRGGSDVFWGHLISSLFPFWTSVLGIWGGLGLWRLARTPQAPSSRLQGPIEACSPRPCATLLALSPS